MKRTFLIGLLLFILINSAYPQNYADHWYIGPNGAIEFNDSTCLAVPFFLAKPWNTISMTRSTSGASISDRNGNILLITNGEYIYNKYLDTIKNSSDAIPHNMNDPQGYAIWRQGLMFLPNPEFDSIYYLLQANMEDLPGWGFPILSDPRNGFRITTIDVAANNGHCEVIRKNQVLRDTVCETLTAVHHSNGKDIWIMTHDYGNRKWNSYLLSRDGFSAPVESIIGDTIGRWISQGNFTDFRSEAKFSPDGRYMIHFVNYYSGTQLYKFDNVTGRLTDVVNITSNQEDHPYYSTFRGLEFSPDSRKLYGLEDTVLVQYDITVYDSAAIASSRREIYTLPSTAFRYTIFQLTPDGYILLLYQNKKEIGIIRCPDLTGTECGFSFDSGINDKFAASYYSAPVFMQSWFRKKPLDLSASLSYNSPAAACRPLRLQATNVKCANYLWEGPNDFLSIDQNPVINDPEPGMYYCTVSNCEDSFVDSMWVDVSPAPKIEFVTSTGNVFFCRDGGIIITTKNKYTSYLWSTGERSDSIHVFNTGTYYVKVADSLGCEVVDSIHVEEYSLKIWHADKYSLENICMGMDFSFADSLINIGKISFKIDSIYLSDGSGAILTGDYSPDREIRYQEKVSYKLRLNTITSGILRDTVNILIQSPCSTLIKIPIEAKINQGQISIIVPDTTSTPGERFCLPITAESSCEGNQLSGDLLFKMDLAGDILYDLSLTNGSIISNSYTNGILTLEILIRNLNLTRDYDTVSCLCGLVLLSDRNESDIDIHSVAYGSYDFPLYIKNGSLELIGVCNSTLRRIKLISSDRLAILPNPSSDYIEISSPSIKRGSGGVWEDITIFNTFGECVYSNPVPTGRDTPVSGGQERIDVSGLVPGVYFVRVGNKVSKFVKM